MSPSSDFLEKARGKPGRAATDNYKLLKNGEIQLINKTDEKVDRLYTTDASGNVRPNSEVYTVDKKSSSEVSIIGQLSQTNDIKVPNLLGQAVNPFFSEEFTKDLGTAFGLYNFLENNTDSGIEFSLGSYNVNGENNYQIATKHNINNSKIFSNKFSNDNLVWSIHNHDGAIGLDYKNISNQFDTDYETAKGIMWNNYKKNISYPSFYIVNDNMRLIEINNNGANTNKTYPFTTQFLKSIKRK